MATPKHTHIAYRCPDCGTMIYGIVGESVLNLNMRLKCTCGASALDITVTTDKKLKLSIPCVLCKENHSFIVSPSVFFERDIFLLNCPYANIDIGFIGLKEKVDEAAQKNAEALTKLISDMGAQALSELQPMDMDDDEILPDAEVYDIIRFIVKDLEAEGAIDCPCHSGSYDIRYAPFGIQVYCNDCGAAYDFNCRSVSIAEEYLGLSELKLK